MLKVENDIKNLWSKYRQEFPNARIYDVAQSLKLSEEQLVVAGCGLKSTKLMPRYKEWLLELKDFGPLLALTRNEFAVIEKTGIYQNVQFNRRGALVLADKIDLRFFPQNWATLYAVELNTAAGVKKGFQIFDHNGHAVHKIYLTNSDQDDHFFELLDRFKWTPHDESEVIAAKGEEPPVRLPSKNDVDATAFLTDWANMKDTHEFLGLLNRYKLSRFEALKVQNNPFVKTWNPLRLMEVIQEAASGEVPIMIFVGNQGCIQIHSGPIYKVVTKGSWFNILDRDFNLHLNTQGLAELFRVEKPTKDGTVTSLEAFDTKGELILQVFGVRKPGQKELDSWRNLL